MAQAPNRPRGRQPGATREGGRIQRPNRIHELWKQRGWTVAEVAQRVREIAAARGDEARMKTAEGTISRLSTGAMTLDQDWMLMLARVFGVEPGDIITRPLAEGSRPVTVSHALATNGEPSGPMPESERYVVLVPDDEELRGVDLYAAEVRGPSMNLRYPPGSILILSPLMQRPGEIAEGRRYHVILAGETPPRETVKLLCARGGRLWLVPESDDPEHQAWLAFDGTGRTTRLVGRVRSVYMREP